MAKKIAVILLEDVPTIGRAGDVAEVAEGFARNNLFPEGKAALAESKAGKRVQRTKERVKADKEHSLTAARTLAEQLDGTELIMRAKVKEAEGNEIFGSINAKHIAEELSKQTDQSFTAKQVRLDKPIRTLGTISVTLVLLPDVESEIQVTVVDEEA